MAGAALEATVAISWDGTATFDGPYDDVTHDTASTPGLVLNEGRDSAQTLAPPKIQAGSFELFNDSGKFSQLRADSPVYQRVLPGRPVRARARWGDARAYNSHTAYNAHVYYNGRVIANLAYHLIESLAQRTAWGDRRVAVDTIGREVLLTDSVVTVPIQSEIRTDQAVTLLLDAAGWPTADRAISIGDTTLLWWWCDERHPWDALLELLAAEGPGTMYVDRDGVFRWESRTYRAITERCQTPQAVYNGTSSEAAIRYGDHIAYNAHRRYNGRADILYFTSLGYDPAYQSIWNRATYPTTRRVAGATAVVWQYGSTITLTADQSVTLFARPSDPFVGAVTPAVGTDYTVPTGAATVALTYSSGLVAFIVVTAGPSGATIDGPTATPDTGIQLRAQPLTVASQTTVQNGVDTSESIAKYSPIPGAAIPRTLALQGWPEIAPAGAIAVCDAWVSRYQEPRPLITITVRNADVDHLHEIMTRMLSDRIRLKEDNTGLDDDAWINALELRVTAAGRVVELVLGCELCDLLTGAVWDLSVWDDPSAVWGI